VCVCVCVLKRELTTREGLVVRGGRARRGGGGEGKGPY